MTIDEVISYEKKCSERSDTFVGYTTEEHKQLAEWLEEFKALKEKNVAKKPIIHGLGQRYCPVCKCGGADHFYCPRCGQKLG